MMNIPTKQLRSGFRLPVYGIGLWHVGGRWDIDTSRDEQEITAIQSAIDLGVTHIDTAESYANGHSEELLGKALHGYERKSLTIATKVSGSHQSYDNVMKSCEASLKRIGTDYIDLYILHSYPDKGMHIVDTMRALDELVAQGVVKNIGVSNMTINRFAEAQKYTANKIVCNQLHYNVQYREVEDKGLLRHCQDSDVFLVAWRPLQKGIFSQSPFLAELAEKYNKTPSQIALNWLISQKNVVTIAKTSNLTHLEENLGAIGWDLDAADIELIRTNFPDQKLVSDAVPLDYEADIPA